MRSIIYILPLAASFFGSTQAGVLGGRGFNVEQRSSGPSSVHDPTLRDEPIESLSKRTGRQGMKWEVYTINHDFETDYIIFDIRKSVNHGAESEFTLHPDDEDWKKIAATTYYSELMSGSPKEIKEITISCYDDYDSWEDPIITNRLGFGYILLEEGETPVAETSSETPTTET